MVIPRPSIRWSQCYRQTFRTARTHTYNRSRQQIQRRGYASETGGGAHGEHKARSELPWAITSIGITIPAVYYLIQPQLKPKKHGGGHGHGDREEHSAEAHEEEHSEGEDEPSKEAKPEEQGEEEQQGKEEEQGKEEASGTSEGGGDSSNSDSEAGGQDTPETSDDEGDSGDAPHEREGGGNVSGVRFKGAMSGGTKEGEQGDTRLHIPDAKGGAKNRIQSHYAKSQGQATEDHQSPENEDLAAASKSPGGHTTQSGKQEGISNTDTKHSTDLGSNPETSKKGDGMPETAKAKGTVDPHRNAAGERA